LRTGRKIVPQWSERVDRKSVQGNGLLFTGDPPFQDPIKRVSEKKKTNAPRKCGRVRDQNADINSPIDKEIDQRNPWITGQFVDALLAG
jgi:hypothetical protein